MLAKGSVDKAASGACLCELLKWRGQDGLFGREQRCAPYSTL